jgi:hypothetical protein
MKGLLASFLCLAVAGCAITGPTYVTVDSMASYAAAEKRTYYLFSARRGLTLKNAQYRKYAGLTDEILLAAGFTKTDSPDTANVIVALIYGVDRIRDGNRMRRTSFVELSAYDWVAVRDEGVRNTIWRTEIYTAGSHGGYSRNIPMLLKAAGPYVATNMLDPVEVVVD